MSPKMARKVDKTVKLCVICGDKAKGINFNALTCMSCKAFFRRNALRNKEMKCPFNDSCQVDKITRKFCSKCRLKKCFDCGMKKEWILSDEEKRLIKEKIMRNRIRRQQQEMDQQAQRSGGSGTSGALVKIDPASVTTQGRRRHTVKDKQAARSSLSMDNQLAPYHASSNSSTFGSSTYCNSPSPNPFNGYGSKQITGSSSYNFFTEPSSYSLDILLTQDDCEPLMDSNYGANNAFGPSSNSQDDLFYSSPEPPKTSVLIDPKKDEFLSNSPPLDLDQEPMRRLSSTCAPSISASLNDCCSLLFANMDSIDLFDSDFLSMDFATSCNPGSDFSTSGQSSSYYGQGHQGSSCMESHVVEIKNSSSSSYNSSSSANGNNNYLKNEDFAQYLMQDNDPFTFNSQDQHLHQPSLFGDGRINATMDKPNTSNQTNRNWNQGFQDQMSPSKNNTVAVYNQQQSSNDYLTNYLLNENEMDHEISNFDPVIELIPRITSEGSFFRDIGFSNRELIQPERCLIKELRDACSILQNPYKRILYINLKTREDDSPHKCRITEFFIHRLIRMSRRLSSFAGLRLPDQVQLLKRGLIEMLCLRSVLLYDPDREAWCFQDDKCKLSIMVNLDVIKSSCLRADFQRHKNYPRLFLNEWKTDGVIFDLLTAIVLFTPRKDCADFDKIKEEKMRYTHLLRRYLEIKYPTIAEAKSTFSRLMACLEEVRLLNEDITRFFISLGKLHSSPLFAQLLDLPITQSNSPPPPPPPPASTVFYNPDPTNEPNMAGSPSSRNSSPNIYLNLEPMQQQASPASSTSSNAQAYVNQSNFVPYNACSTGTSGGASLMAQQCQQQHC